MNRRLTASYLIASLSLFACKDQSLVACKQDANGQTLETSHCVAQSPDERAMLALNEGRYEEVVALLEPLISGEPEVYYRYPRLAAAYASIAGMDLLEAISGVKTGGGGGITALAAFIPAMEAGDRAGYLVKIENLERARDLLLEMPDSERANSSGSFYGASAFLQLFLYRSSASVMRMNYYIVPTNTEDGKLDEEVLSELTSEQAIAIIEELKNSATGIAANGGNEKLQKNAEKIDETVAKIETFEGDNLGEKLQSYLRDQEAKKAAAAAEGAALRVSLP